MLSITLNASVHSKVHQTPGLILEVTYFWGWDYSEINKFFRHIIMWDNEVKGDYVYPEELSGEDVYVQERPQEHLYENY